MRSRTIVSGALPFALLIAMVASLHAQQTVPLQEQMAAQQKILVQARQQHDRKLEARTLNSIGYINRRMGKRVQAEQSYRQAIVIEKAASDFGAEAASLIGIGNIYRDRGLGTRAIVYFNNAMRLAQQAKDNDAEANAHSSLGAVENDLGQKERALREFSLALPMCRAAQDHECEMNTMNHQGWAYEELGQWQRAIDTYAAADAAAKAINNTLYEAKFLNNIGWVYQKQGMDAEAQKYLTPALAAAEAVNDYVTIGDTLVSLSRVAGHMGDAKGEMEYARQGLVRSHTAGISNTEADALWSMADASRRMQDAAGQLRYALAARAVAAQINDPGLMGNTDATLMQYFHEQKQERAAIFFGMDAVNHFQQIRRNITGLGEDEQKTFAQSKSATYRQLAELLVQADRLSEAEHVLDLLKEQELNEVLRGGGDAPLAKTAPLRMDAAQTQAQGSLATPEKTAASLTELSLEYAALAAEAQRTPAEETRMQALDSQIEAGNNEVSDFLRKTFYAAPAAKVGATAANAEFKIVRQDLSQLQSTLGELGPEAMGVRMLYGDEHVYAIVVTSKSHEKYQLAITPDDLRVQVLAVREELRWPIGDPRPDLQKLYTALVGPWSGALKTFEDDARQQNKTPVLLWSLDGILRYLPMAALYDGHQYMVERFENVLFTPDSYGHMKDAPAANGAALQVLAMGLSKSYGGLKALPGVLPELKSIAHDPAVPDSSGPMAGKLLYDDGFTLTALKDELGKGKTFPVVHIASHFVEVANGGDEPYLMLGGENAGTSSGYALTLSKIQDSTISFTGTRLLTLSACSTAKGDAAKDGMEMDSLGMVAQQKDAEAVMATLWDVNDASTSRLMSEFYTRWVGAPADGKGAALRSVQMEFLRGESAPATMNAALLKARRGLDDDDDAPQKPGAATLPGMTHPFYWAPFVLIGNYR